MKRKLVFAGGCYLAGLYSASFLFKGLSLLWLLVGSLAAGGLIFYRYKKLGVLGVFALCYFIGLEYYCLFWEFSVLPFHNLDGNPVEFQGVIVEVDEYSGDRSGYHVKGNFGKGAFGETVIYGDSFICSPGDEITFSGIASEISENSYRTPLSYEESNGIFIKVTEVSDIKITRRNQTSLLGVISGYRKELCQIIRRYLPGEEGALVTAMLCGDKSGLSPATRTNLYRSGIGHLTAVSGTHMTMILMFFWFFLPKNKLPLWVRSTLTIAVASAFAVFAGLTPSVLRAGFLVLMLTVSDLAGRKSDFLTSLMAGAVLITFGSPAVIWSPSFVLSFAGAWGVGCLAPKVLSHFSKKGYFASALTVSFSASAAVLLPSALYFPEIPLIGSLFSVFLTPICTAILFCGLAVALTGGLHFLAVPLLLFAGLSGKIVLYVSKLFGSWSFLVLPAGPSWVVPASLIGTAAVLYFFFTKKHLGFAALFFLIVLISLYSGNIIWQASCRKLVYVARFSESCVITSGTKAVILDMGSGRDFYSIGNYLQSKGIRSAEIAVVSGRKNKSEAEAEKRLYLCSPVFRESAADLELPKGKLAEDSSQIVYQYGSILLVPERLKPGTELVLDNKGNGKERRTRYAADEG